MIELIKRYRTPCKDSRITARHQPGFPIAASARCCMPRECAGFRIARRPKLRARLNSSAVGIRGRKTTSGIRPVRACDAVASAGWQTFQIRAIASNERACSSASHDRLLRAAVSHFVDQPSDRAIALPGRCSRHVLGSSLFRQIKSPTRHVQRRSEPAKPLCAKARAQSKPCNSRFRLGPTGLRHWINKTMAAVRSG